MRSKKAIQVPLVSVIIPIFNTGRSCIKILKTLQRSSYKNIEVICIDDGSNDDSYNIISEFSKKFNNIIVKKQKNAGASAARNTGIKIASGEFISFIDSDDEIDVTFIEKLANAYDDKTILACTALQYRRIATGEGFTDFTKKIRPRRPHESVKEYVCYMMLQDGRLYGVINKIFRNDIIKENNLFFDVTMNFAEDTKFVLDYINAAIKEYPQDCNILTIYEPLYIYNYGTETSTASRSSLEWDNWKKSYRYLTAWSDDEKTITIYFRNFLIWTRWRISHALSVARSSIPSTEKKKYINSFELSIANILVKIRK